MVTSATVDAETDLDGQLAPTNVFHVQGIFSQYDSGTPPDSGYEILPRLYTDITFIDTFLNEAAS